MTETPDQPPIQTLIADLDARAHAASVAEQDHQKDAVRRAAELKRAREFAWRRLNLVRAVATAVAAAETDEAATAAGRTTFLRQFGWTGATEAQRTAAERFAPVTLAIWSAGGAEGAAALTEPADPAAALAALEAWYEADRGHPLLAVMDREPLDLPLVEI